MIAYASIRLNAIIELNGPFVGCIHQSVANLQMHITPRAVRVGFPRSCPMFH